MTQPAVPLSAAPVEPVLELDDIQGIAVPGFFKPHQTLLGLRVPDGATAAEHFKSLVRALAVEVTDGRRTLLDRRSYRDERHKTQTRHRTESDVVLVALAFSNSGLLRLTPGAAAIDSEAFQLGMAARSKFLGDPADPHAEGHPSRWVVGGTGAELDALLIVAGDHRDTVTARADVLAHAVAAHGIELAYREDGDVREDPDRGHEHFGFDDGVSQPGIRGRASDAPSDFITSRRVAPTEIPATWLFGYPGQDLVWPGEFVLGYPATSPDPLMPGPPSRNVPHWTRNGSFLVFRRLRQDVGLFWRTMRELAASLAERPGFTGITADALAARLVGRWHSGAPFNRTPGGDVPELGGDRHANNYFTFDADTPPIVRADGTPDPFPALMAKADPAGITCPWAAHIRKVNTRDAGSDMGARDSTYARRLLRVGITFGKSLADRFAHLKDDPDKGNRGLMFLSIQSSIEDQFEFLSARWINDDARPKAGGHDMLVGQNAATPDGVRRCTLVGAGLQEERVTAERQWVIPTGGGYFFVPSMTALREVLAR
jgi:Dyp-type peroxidase family